MKGSSAAALYPGLSGLDNMADEGEYARRTVSQPTAESRLLSAVMGVAIEDLARGPGQHARTIQIYRDARAWVESNDTLWPCSFVPLCIEFKLDIEATRKELLAITPGVRRLVDIRPRAMVSTRPVFHAGGAHKRKPSWRNGDRRPGSRR